MKDGTIRITVLEGSLIRDVDRIYPNPLALPGYFAIETKRAVEDFTEKYLSEIMAGRIKIEIE